MNRSVLLFVALIFSYSVLHATEKKLTILFNSGSSAIAQQESERLDSLISALQRTFDFEVFIAGHTDNVGTMAYNDVLAKDRAVAIADYLHNGKIAAESIHTDAYGELAPVSSNASDDLRSRNRRVVLTIMIYDFANEEELEEALKSSSRNTFVIDNSTDQVVKGKNGCRAYIPGQSFQTVNGVVYTGEVKLEVVEAIEMGDFVANRLTTVSDDRYLESGGMVRVSATTMQGEPLSLDPQQAITVSIPTAAQQDGMELFVSDEGANWNETGRAIKDPYANIVMPDFPMRTLFQKKLPVFERDLSSKPVHPTKLRAPRKPKTPDPTIYEAKITWYNFLWAGKIKADAQKKYMHALARYEKRIARYDHLKGLYDHTELNYDGNVMHYKEALALWNGLQVEDSLAFIQSEAYLAVLRENEYLRERSQASYDKKVANWYALRREKVGEIADRLEAMGLQSDEMVGQYVTNMTALNWINIDRFWKMSDRDMFDITVRDQSADESARVVILFNDISSMLPLKRMENDLLTQRIPKQADAMLFSYKVEDGKTWVCLKPINTKTSYSLDYKPYTFKQLKALLADLG